MAPRCSSYAAFAQISPTAKYTGTPIPFDEIAALFTAEEEGYLYVYVSNEHHEDAYVYFDDFKVTLTQHPVIQTDDYYPLPAPLNRGACPDEHSEIGRMAIAPLAFQKAGAQMNDFLFQGQEKQDELDLGWYQFKWRNHDPALGRFFNVDPLADTFIYNSPYAFSENKVTNHVELEGLEAIWAQFEGRISVPVLPVGFGLTESVAIGIALDFSNTKETGVVKGMTYHTTSIGVQNGTYGGGGLEVGGSLSATLDNLKGLGANFGVSFAMDIIGGPNAGGELNLMLDNSLGAGMTLESPFLSYGIGGTGYADISNLQPVTEFDFNLFDSFESFNEGLNETLNETFNLLKESVKGFDMEYEEFQKTIYKAYESMKEYLQD